MIGRECDILVRRFIVQRQLIEGVVGTGERDGELLALFGLRVMRQVELVCVSAEATDETEMGRGGLGVSGHEA